MGTKKTRKGIHLGLTIKQTRKKGMTPRNAASKKKYGNRAVEGNENEKVGGKGQRGGESKLQVGRCRQLAPKREKRRRGVRKKKSEGLWRTT